MYDKLTTPVVAFITFESDDGYNTAVSYSKKKKWFQKLQNNQNEEHEGPVQQTIFNKVPMFTPATEPTNIIWENRHIKGFNLGARVTGAVLISLFMLILSFGLIIYFKQTAIHYGDKYPNVQCKDLTEQFSKANIDKYAGLEYQDQIETNGTAPMVGALKCHCEAEIKEFGQLTVYNKNYTYHYVDPTTNKNTTVSAKICHNYILDIGKLLVMNNSIKYIIIIINTVIRMVVIKIITLVGCDTESSQMKYTTDAVFICQFFNTGFLLMLCNANLAE